MNQTFTQEVSRFPTHQNSYTGSKTSEYIIIIFGLSTKPKQLIKVARLSASQPATVPSPLYPMTSFFFKPMKSNQPKITEALASKEKISYHEAHNHLYFMQSSKRLSQKAV
jgi:hypothetical protein